MDTYQRERTRRKVFPGPTSRVWISTDSRDVLDECRVLLGAIEDGQHDPTLLRVMDLAVAAYRGALLRRARSEGLGAEVLTARLVRRAETPSEVATVDRLRRSVLDKSAKAYKSDTSA